MLMDTWRGDHRGTAPQLDLAFRRDTPLPAATFPVTIGTPSASGRLSLIPSVGANAVLDENGYFIPSVDFVDARILHAAATDVTRFTTRSRLFRTAVQAGGYDRLNVQLAEPWADDDQDGMADLWESRYHIDLTPNDDHDRDGYTNLEEFLNGTNPFQAIHADAFPAVHVEPDSRGRIVIVDTAGTANRLTVTATEEILVIASTVSELSLDGMTLSDRIEIPADHVTGEVFAWLGAGDDELDLSHLTISATVMAGSGRDTIHGTEAADLISGGRGADRITAGAGNDLLFGGADDDELIGGAGNDRLFGQAGSDVLLGGAGDDLLKGQGASRDHLTGGPGIDTVDGGAGGDRLFISTADFVFADLTDVLADDLSGIV